MTRVLVALCPAVFVLASCAPLNTYYKEGASVDRLNRDTTACKVKALQDVPRSTIVEHIPPQYVPPVRDCDSSGNCRIVRAGYFVPGETYSYDPNDGLRRDVERQCMADRGYGRVSIDPCPDSVARATPPRATTRLPKLTPASCAIRNDDGSFQIVNRG